MATRTHPDLPVMLVDDEEGVLASETGAPASAGLTSVVALKESREVMPPFSFHSPAPMALAFSRSFPPAWHTSLMLSRARAKLTMVPELSTVPSEYPSTGLSPSTMSTVAVKGPAECSAPFTSR